MNFATIGRSLSKNNANGRLHKEGEKTDQGVTEVRKKITDFLA